MHKKSLEICLYVAGAGAFGVFLRWLENQLAFNELGLADPSAFHVMLIAFLVACVLVFRHFLLQMEEQGYVLPKDVSLALGNQLQLHWILAIAAGAVMALGGLLLFAGCETDKFAGMLRLLSALALLSGAAYPLVMREAEREEPRPALLCALMILPMLLYALWLIISYRNNAINSVPLAYGLEMLTAIVCMAAYFQMAGFGFGAPRTRQSLLFPMLSATLCIMSLADERYTGMQLILLATAGEMLLYNWILLQNLEQKERIVVVKKDDGFEHL